MQSYTYVHVYVIQMLLRHLNTHLKFEWTGVRTHDLWIMHSIFNVHEMLTLITEPSGTSTLILAGGFIS